MKWGGEGVDRGCGGVRRDAKDILLISVRDRLSERCRRPIYDCCRIRFMFPTSIRLWLLRKGGARGVRLRVGGLLRRWRGLGWLGGLELGIYERYDGKELRTRITVSFTLHGTCPLHIITPAACPRARLRRPNGKQDRRCH